MTEKSTLIRLPERKFQLLISIVKTSQILHNKLQREPSLAEIANYINVPVAKLISLIYHVQPIISLEEEIEGKEGKFTVGELIEDKKAFLTQTAPFIKDLKEKLEEVLKQLSPLEEEVITSRFGLRDEEPQTFSDIASRLNLSRERVRQITENALHKLRRIQITRDLLPFIEEIS
jgi:RNA polymerase primary sigma factor